MKEGEIVTTHLIIFFLGLAGGIILEILKGWQMWLSLLVFTIVGVVVSNNMIKELKLNKEVKK